MTLLRSLAVALVAAAACAQQRAVEDRIAAAAAAGGKPSEFAALELAAARAALDGVGDAAVRAQLEKRIVELAAKVDPLDRTGVAAAREVAARLLGVAGVYEAKGWLQTAQEYARLAARLSPEDAREPLLRLQSAMAKAAAEATAASRAGRPALDVWFRGGEPVQGREDWRFDDDSLMAPSLADTTDTAVFLSGLRARSELIRFEADIVGPMTGRAGLILGVRNLGDFVALDVKVQGIELTATLVRREPAGNKVLREAKGQLPASYASPPEGEPKRVRVAVEVRGLQVLAKVGDVELEARLAEPLHAGLLGLRARNTGDHGFRPTFARIAVTAEVR
jgi:hypothetical protein